MENNINNIDKFFKDHLAGHESAPVPNAWEDMEAMLDADKSGLLIKNINRYILTSIAGAIVLAGAVVAYISGYTTNTPIYADNNISEKQIITPAPAAQQKTENIVTVPENSTAVASTNNTHKTLIEKNTTANTAINNTVSSASPTAPVKTPHISEARNPIVLANDDTNEFEKAIIENTDSKETFEYAATELYTKKDFSNILLTSISPKFKIAYPNFIDLIESQKVFADSTQKAERKLDEIQRFYRTQFGIQAGTNFNKVLSNTSNSFQVGSGVMAGLFFSKNFNRRWAINAELNYLRSTGNNLMRTITQTEFFLEKTTTNFVLVTKTFDYIQLPISVSYSITQKHKFSIGTSFMLLINAKTEIAEHTQKFAEKTLTTVTQSGVYEDLNTLNYGLLLGYEFNLPSRYSLGVRYNQMFNDVSKDHFFNNTKKHLPAHLQLFVKLNLTK